MTQDITIPARAGMQLVSLDDGNVVVVVVDIITPGLAAATGRNMIHMAYQGPITAVKKLVVEDDKSDRWARKIAIGFSVCVFVIGLIWGLVLTLEKHP